MYFSHSFRLPPFRVVATGTVLFFFAGLAWTSAPADPKKTAAPSVAKDHAAQMTKGLELFKKHVQPLLRQRCLKCHGGKKIKADFDLSTRKGLLRGGESGPAILLGKARASLLYQLITHAKEPRMPKGGKLAAGDVAQIAAWIDCGAPYDGPLAGPEKATSWTQKEVSADARRFWSFQPLHRTNPPRVKNGAWVRTPLDRFILAKLEAAGLRPNRPATRRQLIRRAYFDVIGLPPAPEEVEAFVNDSAPDAYERLLDRLLASPHHGERWARHWLDLARFAESHGFEHDYDRPSAYHYRDFVIKAFNQDMPFDQFVQWQIAGDEIAPDNNLALTATGFLAAGVHSTQITKNEVEKQRYDELDDMLATIGTSMLGLTIGCARCHDHKFDPIPQRDYYRLLSTFTTTVRSEIDLNTDPEDYRRRKAIFDLEHAPYIAALKSFEADQLPARLAHWEKSEAANPKSFPWVILDVTSAKSQGGAIFKRLPDGSLLAGGANAKFDIYTFSATTDLTGIRSIRLEALADPSLVKGGPGRAANGNFALTDFRVTAAPKDGKGKPVPIPVRNARATFEQSGLPVKAAIDDDPKSAWAVDPQFGKDHAATFETVSPVGFPGGTILTFSLRFNCNTGHNIGRPRLAITTAQPTVDLRAAGIPQGVLSIVKAPAASRTPSQSAALLAWFRTTDPQWQKVTRQLEEHSRKAPKPALVKALISSEGLPAIRLHTQGGDFLTETDFLRRGDPTQKEGVANQGFLQVLMTAPDRDKHWQTAPPKGWRTSFRRRALANWLTDVHYGAGQLLARVIVNRLWQHHMGRGIVATPSDFGTRGEPPSHPQLLDWLATELIQNGWRLKPIHKLIMASAVYRQSSRSEEAKRHADREDRLFWRRPLHRLEAETIRDTLLVVGGRLDGRMYGPGTLDPANRRRSIYFTVKRSRLLPAMQLFDAPEALTGVGARPTTTIAPQALLLLNNPNVRASAKAFARRITRGDASGNEEAIKAGYRIAVARPPSAEELTDAAVFIKRQIASYKAAGKANARELGYADFCQVLVCLNEFVYVE
jgi:hypothetical protein